MVLTDFEPPSDDLDLILNKYDVEKIGSELRKLLRQNQVNIKEKHKSLFTAFSDLLERASRISLGSKNIIIAIYFLHIAQASDLSLTNSNLKYLFAGLENSEQQLIGNGTR
ncbi:MAG: hypothetical protein ACFE9R_11295, partial [Candidatus Hermodarchaeota archaeon]